MVASKKAEEELSWLGQIEPLLPVIEDLVKARVTEPYRRSAYEVLLTHALSRTTWTSSARAMSSTSISLPAVGESGPLPARFSEFLKTYEIDPNDLPNLYDISRGQVIVRNVGSTKSEGQRQLAALIAVMQAQKSGEFRVPRELHAQQCTTFGVYDSANYASTMRWVEHGGTAVFTQDGKDWVVTRPGEAYLASVIKAHLVRKNGGNP